MPIPTRSQSLAKRVDADIPVRKPSIRRIQPSTSHPSQELKHGKNESAAKITPDSRVATGIPQLREPTRPHTLSLKSSSHTRTASTTNVANTSVTATGKPTNNDVQNRVQTRLAARTADSTISGRSYARTASSAAPKPVEPTPARPSRLKPPIPSDTKTGSLAKQPAVSSTHSNNHQQGQQGLDSPLRDELLQLQLLHTGATAKLALYTHSIEEFKKSQKIDMNEYQNEIIALENSNSQAISSATLQNWLEQNRGTSKEQRIQDLSTVFGNIERLMNDPECLQPLHQFQVWLTEADTVRELRETQIVDKLPYVALLGPVWHANMIQLQSDVSNIIMSLSQFGTAADDSGLSLALEKTMSFAKLLLQEIETAIQLEKMIEQAETTWIAESLSSALADLPATETSSASKAKAGLWTT